MFPYSGSYRVVVHVLHWVHGKSLLPGDQLPTLYGYILYPTEIRILTNSTFSVWAVSGSSQGVLRVVSRWNWAKDSETQREKILTKRTFWRECGLRMERISPKLLPYHNTPQSKLCRGPRRMQPIGKKIGELVTKLQVFVVFLAYLLFLL